MAPARQPEGAARAKWIDALGAERRKIATPRRFDVDDGVPFEEVVALVPGPEAVTIRCSSGASHTADRVVLALGAW